MSGIWQRLFRHCFHPFFLEIRLMKYVGVGGSWLSPGSVIRCQSDPHPHPPTTGVEALKPLEVSWRHRWLGLKKSLASPPLAPQPEPWQNVPGEISQRRQDPEIPKVILETQLKREGGSSTAAVRREWVRRLAGREHLSLPLSPSSALPWSSAGRAPFGRGTEGRQILPAGAQGSGHSQASAEAVPAACQVREGINLLFKASD